MEVKELIQKAQAGNEEARAELVQAMLDDGCMKRVAQYLQLNRLLEPDDVRGEFWLGVVKGMADVKYRLSPEGEEDKNNPLKYLAWRGILQVRKALKQRIRRRVFYVCQECGHEGQLKKVKRTEEERKAKRSAHYACSQCGSTNFKEKPLEREIAMLRGDARTSASLIDEIDLREFMEQLTPQERRVVELMLSGYNRDRSKNYLKDIGDALNVTPQCVSIYLGKIRRKFKIHLEG